jgi:murein DD-endopeptidase MepM/ murein hydrolase activator NlpD
VHHTVIAQPWKSMHVRSPAVVRRLAMTTSTVALAVATLLGAAPASAAPGDYQQVVDITFPFERGVEVQYRDDYAASRGGDRHHQATDLMVAGGTPIHAAMGGTVTWVSGSRDGGPPSYGWMVRIAGDDGRDYAYVHMGWQDRPWRDAYAPGVDRGARIERGDLLGWAGCSGSAACGGGEHLHFEIHDATVDDPYDYHDHERINPYRSLVAAEERGDYPEGGTAGVLAPFLDVPSSSVHAADIAELAQRRITAGCDTGRFCPGQPVTRQQMASFLVRALDLPAADGHDFVDVAPTNVHARDIAALAAADITAGCADDAFCPQDPVTREQMASFLVRALDLPEGDGHDFVDVAPTNVHAQDIAALAAAAITAGCADDAFCPSQDVTREQMASFLVRSLRLLGR